MIVTTHSHRERFDAFIKHTLEDLERGIIKPDYMVSELFRINSFKNLPTSAYKDSLWPTALARAGFYLHPGTGATMCYSCGLSIPLEYWWKGVDPQEEHRARRPGCEYINGRAKNNIAFQTQQQRDNNEPYLGTRSPRVTSARGRLVTDHGGATSSGATSGGATSGGATSGGATSGGATSGVVENRSLPGAGNQATPPVTQQQNDPDNDSDGDGPNAFRIQPRPRNHGGVGNQANAAIHGNQGGDVVHSLPVNTTLYHEASAQPPSRNPRGRPGDASFQSLPIYAPRQGEEPPNEVARTVNEEPAAPAANLQRGLGLGAPRSGGGGGGGGLGEGGGGGGGGGLGGGGGGGGTSHHSTPAPGAPAPSAQPPNQFNSAPASLPYQGLVNQHNGNNSTPPFASMPFQGMANRLTGPRTPGGTPSGGSRNNSTAAPGGGSTELDGVGGDPIRRMKSEEARLMTFVHWPNRSAVVPEDLAVAGFFYTGSMDRVQCAFCENVLRNWEPGDNPTYEHRRHFPRCPFVLGRDVSNVTMTAARRQQAVENLLERTQAAGVTVGVTASTNNRQQPAAHSAPAPAYPAMNNTQLPAPPVTRSAPPARPGSTPGAAGVNALNVLNVNTELPRHPEYAIQASRLMTYRAWAANSAQAADTLCRAGFYYTGFDDNVRCFYCDGGLRNWEREDDPFTEHARWFPRCRFIRETKGEDFVNALSARYPRVQNMPNTPANAPALEVQSAPPSAPTTVRAASTSAPTARAQPPPGGASSGYHTAGVSSSPVGGIEGMQYRVDEREVRSRMDTPAVRAVLDMGFDRNIVMSAIRKQLRTKGVDFPSAEMLLEALFVEEDLVLRERNELEPVDEGIGDEAPESAASRAGESAASRAGESTGPQGAPSGAPEVSAASQGQEPAREEPALGGATEGNQVQGGATERNQANNSVATTGSATGTATGGATGNGEAQSGATNDSNNQSGPLKKRKKGKKKQGKSGDNRTPPPEDSTAPVGKQKPSAETRSLLEENRALKDQRMCKVCMDAEADIVFLPCGHLVCCASCAPALRNCAVCRSLIRGTVKTYMS